MYFLVALLLAASTAVPNPEDAVARVTVEETRSLLARNDAVLVDVRGQVPFELQRIAGAVSIPLGTIAARASELPKDKLIVTYCTCSHDELSVSAVVALQKAGIERAAALQGGMNAWTAAGLPTESDNHEPPVVNEDPPGAARGGRLRPPAGVTCDRNQLTLYSGRVTRFTRTRSKTTITIATDWDTTETAVSPAPRYLLDGEPMRSSDWKRVGKGKRANVWVCGEKGVATVIDWHPDETRGT
ncbi:MAG TPA: rhodanese-like domain-containing protein [Thermoanaerobaculia bacterium]|jgi:rhodanese-related sulfurtransferase|nr:rhodanese-like domain-containing protein [Thermoanaerobaculia bacterium]